MLSATIGWFDISVRTDSLEKTLMLGKIEGRRRRGRQRMRWLDGITGDDRGWDGWMASLTRWTWVWVSSGCWWWAGKPGVLQSMGLQRVGHNWATELNWCCDYNKVSTLTQEKSRIGRFGDLPVGTHPWTVARFKGNPHSCSGQKWSWN